VENVKDTVGVDAVDLVGAILDRLTRWGGARVACLLKKEQGKECGGI